MNKKNVILILIIVCFLTVMLISTWGAVAEKGSRVQVKDIKICDRFDEEITTINSNTNEEKKMLTFTREDDYSEKLVYDFSVVILPENATDLSLQYEFRDVNNGSHVELVKHEINEEEKNIHRFTITFNEQEDCELWFVTNRKDGSIQDYLQFVWIGSQDGGDIPG